METTSVNSCRGNGLAYIGLHLDDVCAGSRLALVACLADGTFVPSQFYLQSESQGQKDVVVVLPLSNNTIHYRLDEVLPTGEVVDSFTQRVNPMVLKWLSRLNYKLRASLSAQIRDIEATDMFGRAQLHLVNTAYDNGELVLRLTLDTPCAEVDINRLVFYDEAFRPIDLHPIFMGQCPVDGSLDFMNDFTITTFSLRVPSPFTPFHVSYEDREHGVHFGFRTISEQDWRSTNAFVSERRSSAAQDPEYNEWYAARRVSAGMSLALTRQFMKEHPKGLPTFSIVVPVYKPELGPFCEMVKSVLAQTYPKFELLLVSSQEDNAHLEEALQRFVTTDARVHIVPLKSNQGITLNTLAGLQEATGDYVCFLDHDDTLEPETLFEYTMRIVRNPDIAMLYCDEDKLAPNGTFTDPCLKPDFSLYYVRELNYVCHLLCVKKSLVDECYPRESKFDGAQDHCLTLRVAERGLPVEHVDKVLYHWRISQTSTSTNAASKSYANEAGALAIREHLENCGIPAEVHDTEVPFKHEVKYLMKGNPLVSIIIPNKDAIDYLRRCLRSIIDKSSYQNFEIVIVENNSQTKEIFDYYKEIQKRDSRIKVVRWKKAFNFSEVCNFGFAASTGKYVVLLNNDTEVITPDWLERMVAILQDKRVGAVGAKLLYPDGTVQHAGVSMSCFWGPWHMGVGEAKSAQGYVNLYTTTHEVSAVTGACLAVSRKNYKKLKGLDPEFAVAYNDIDFCLRLREKGLLVIYDPFVQLYHYESVSRGYDTGAKKVRLMHEHGLLTMRWAKYAETDDPYLNRGLEIDAYYKLFKGMQR